VDGGGTIHEQARIDPARVREDDTVVIGDGEHLGHGIAVWPDMLTPSHPVVEGGLILHHFWCGRHTPSPPMFQQATGTWVS